MTTPGTQNMMQASLAAGISATQSFPSSPSKASGYPPKRPSRHAPSRPGANLAKPNRSPRRP
ncbi:hypothetical protein N7508_009034 [Penicillium antarcticum]|uniref:uncharacterized protein n=1 Tax=Penicillium antarcticum TaxID=416450 RepID=UPI002386B1B4|nr:uncharacterized protein N7508_009034 [Penicillium antarcticum]KAJ5294213.1 hypothetical protein N7508_009034 [Penicillium antarcticum]